MSKRGNIMVEYIEKYDVYKIIYDFQHEKLKNGQVLISLSELREITFRIPALPIINIIHCKECKYGNHIDDSERLKCFHWLHRIDENCHEPDWFCADGERRIDG